jgi:hypothetical protein
MTDQELNAQRLAAWDNYEAARQRLVALKAQMSEWGMKFSRAASLCRDHPFRIKESELVGLPSSVEITKKCADTREALKEYKKFREQASEFRFPVGADIDIDESDFSIE